MEENQNDPVHPGLTILWEQEVPERWWLLHLGYPCYFFLPMLNDQIEREAVKVSLGLGLGWEGEGGSRNFDVGVTCYRFD